jgi:hypothetical protein
MAKNPQNKHKPHLIPQATPEVGVGLKYFTENMG